MSRINGDFGQLWNGITTGNQNRTGYTQSQVNTLVSAIRGVYRMPSERHIGFNSHVALDKWFSFKSGGETYYISDYGKIFDRNFVEQTLNGTTNFTSDFGFIEGVATLNDKIMLLTGNNKILRRKIIENDVLKINHLNQPDTSLPSTSPNFSPSSENPTAETGYIVFKDVEYARTYQITVRYLTWIGGGYGAPVTNTYTIQTNSAAGVADGNDGAGGTDVGTSTTKLTELFYNLISVDYGSIVSYKENVILFNAFGGTVAPVNFEDQFPKIEVDIIGGALEEIVFVQNYVSDLGDLPKFAHNGTVLEIINAESEKEDISARDNYCLKFDGLKWTPTSRIWGLNEIDETVAPITIEVDSGGDFTVGLSEFKNNESQNSSLLKDSEVKFIWSAPLPAIPPDSGSLIELNESKTIKAIGVYQNRLRFTFDDYLLYSEKDEPLNLFRKFATTILPTDPIKTDVKLLNGDTIEYVTQFYDYDIIHGSNNLVALDGRGGATPNTAGFSYLGDYNFTRDSVSKVVGELLYFTGKQGNFYNVTALSVDFNTGQVSSFNVSQSIDKLIKYGIISIIGTNNGTNLYLTANNEIYLQQYSYGKDGFNAFHKWDLDYDSIEHIDMEDDTVYIISKNGSSKSYLTSIDLNEQELDLDIQYHLHRVQTPTNISITGQLENSNANLFFGNNNIAILKEDIQKYNAENIPFDILAGSIIPITEVLNANNEYNLVVDNFEKYIGLTADKLIVGRLFESSFTPWMPDIYDFTNNVIKDNKMIIDRLFVTTYDTGHVKLDIKSITSGTKTRDLSPIVNNDPLGVPNVDDENYRVAVKQRSKNLTLTFRSDTHLPFNIANIEFEGNYRGLRGRRAN